MMGGHSAGTGRTAGFESPPVFGRGYSDDLGEDAGKIVWVIESYAQGNFGNTVVGLAEEVFCLFHADLVDIDIDVDSGPPLEDSADVGFAAVTEGGKIGNRDSIGDILSDEFQSVCEDGIFAGGMESSGVGRGTVGPLNQPVGKSQILCQHFKTRENIFRTDIRCSNGLAVETGRLFGIQRGIETAGMADAPLNLLFGYGKEPHIDGAQQIIAVENRDHIFPETAVADSEKGGAGLLAL